MSRESCKKNYFDFLPSLYLACFISCLGSQQTVQKRGSKERRVHAMAPELWPDEGRVQRVERKRIRLVPTQIRPARKEEEKTDISAGLYRMITHQFLAAMLGQIMGLVIGSLRIA